APSREVRLSAGVRMSLDHLVVRQADASRRGRLADVQSEDCFVSVSVPEALAQRGERPSGALMRRRDPLPAPTTDDAQLERAAGARALDADDAALLVEPDAVAYGVLHDGLQEQGRDGEGGALRRDVELDVERLAEPRVLDLGVRARVLHL